jgi:predicted ATPase
VIADLPTDFPPLKTLDAHPNNLPIQPTPFIGREKELTAVGDLLLREDVQLLTLTGPGGTGKTRLGLQVAAELSDRFADGVFFVALAPISDPALVMPTIAETLGIREVAGHPPLERLKETLHQKQMLLLLDNFEQVVNAASQIAGLLVACPQLKMVVTSREVLHVRAEHEFAVPPLVLPDPKHLPDLATLSHYAAVALFLQRAQAVKPDFQLTNTNARAVAEICVHLDGLPLAIELAAARMKLLSPQALLTRLGQRFQMLTSATWDVPARQQTLRNTLQWSYDLLDSTEQHLFRALSVFVDGCTLEAAETVCRAAGVLGDVLEGVTQLVDKSLLLQREQEDGEARFWMLQVLREFGLERLAESGEREVTGEAHAQYYLTLAEEVEPHLRGNEQAHWLSRLEQEHENLRAALSWLLERVSMEDGVRQVERALRLGGALLWFWYIRGYIREGWTFLEQVLPVRERAGAAVRAKAVHAASGFALGLDDFERTEALSLESLALFREVRDPVGMTASLYMLANVALVRGQYAVARSRLEESELLYKEVDDPLGRARDLLLIGRVLTCQGEYARACIQLEKSLRLFTVLGDTQRIGFVLYLLARALFVSQEDRGRAHALAEESLALCKEVGNPWITAMGLSLLGRMHLMQGEIARARTLAEESVETLKEIGDRSSITEALIDLAHVVSVQGDLAMAHRLYEESLLILQDIGLKEYVAACLEGWGAVMAAQGTPRKAARLWGAAEALREALGTPLPPVERADHEHSVAASRTALGEEPFAAAWAEGRTMTLEQILAAQGLATLPTTPSSITYSDST